jgi:hypothetical protein
MCRAGRPGIVRMAKRIALAAAGLAAVLAVTAAAGLWFLSDPSRATGFVSARIAAATGQETELAAGWLEPGWRPVLKLRGLRLAEAGEAEEIDARLDPLGLLTQRRPVRFIRIDEARFLYRMRGRAGQGGPPAMLERVRSVDIRQLRLGIQRQGRDPALLIITEATGDLQSGAFSLTAAGGRSVLHLDGSAAGLSLDHFRGEAEMHGRNFAELAAVFGLSAPDTPPFSLYGEISHEAGVWTLSPFHGLVGDSDLEGTMSADFGRPRPQLTADLTSQQLDFDDLGVVIGAPSSIDRTTENDEQETANRAYARSGRLIPDARLDVERVRTADARLRFRADSVTAGPLPVRAMDLVFSLENGVMRFSPLAFRTEDGGRFSISGTIDAASDTVRSDMQGRLSDFDLETVADGGLARGRMDVRFDLVTTGADFRSAFASADGDVTAWTGPDAEIRHLAVEGAGLDLGEILLLRVTEDSGAREFIPVNCAVGRFPVEGGRIRAEQAMVDTDDSVVRMDGVISLHDERIGLDVDAEAKDISWGNLLGGVSVAGTLRDPDIEVNAAASLLQGGAAGLLGSAAGPLAALPFADLGLGEDVPCERLRRQVEDAGSPAAGG